MKFKFCGDLDCPDWVLAEINTLAKMTSVKFKLLCVQVVGQILGGKIDFDKVNKLTADAKLDLGGIKACIAVISFVFTSSAKYSAEEHDLANELQQLGLPKEHTSAICKVYSDNYAEIQKNLQKKSLRLSKFIDLQWRLDYVMSSSHLKEINEPLIHLKLKLSNPDEETHVFTLTDDKFRVLLHELKEAYKIMESLT